MKREDLIISARKLAQPPASASAEFSKKRELLVSEMNQLMSERKDLIELIGEGNLSMMIDNHRNHARFMESVFLEYNPEVLVETVLWVFRAYRTHGFKLTYWPAQLDTWIEILQKGLSPESFSAIYPFYNWMIINQPAFATISDTLIHSDYIPSHGKPE